MGSVLSGVGNVVGGLFGGIGGGMVDAAGASSNFHAQNPYNPQALQQELNQQSQIYGGQQSLAQALQAQMAGQGPNPAQTQFMGNQQSNIANAQGLIASQRGLNPALAARMGANAVSNANQQASLGSALLNQQQQLAATSNLGNLYGQMQQGNLGQQQLYNQANQGAQGINAGTAAQNAAIRGQAAGSFMNAAGGIGSALIGGGGGGAASAASKLGSSGITDLGSSNIGINQLNSGPLYASSGGQVPGKSKVSGDNEKNDVVPAMLSPGEIVIPRSHAHDPEKAKEFIDHLVKSKEKKGGYGEVVAARRKRKE